ncbi:MAG: MGMT family protein [Patescibacteria group bacterium]|nr:MGMT family protein [Patescibacteria group bacterium]
MTPFRQKVFEVVRTIPRGQTLTYGQVAARAGSPRAGRAVGTILARNYDENIPCHRVIGSDGCMHGYNRGGAERKREILQAEKD